MGNKECNFLPSRGIRTAVGAVSVLLAMLALLAVGGCHKEDVKSAPPPPVVDVVAVVQKDVPIYTEWVGALDGSINAVIRPQVTGYLIKQNYREGELVKKGQVLFEIDPRTFQVALDQAKALLSQKKALLRHRKSQPGSDQTSGGKECGQPEGSG